MREPYALLVMRVQRWPARARLRALGLLRDCIRVREVRPILEPPRDRAGVRDDDRLRALILAPLLEPFDVRARLAADAFGRFRRWPRVRVVPRRPPMSMISRFMFSFLFLPGRNLLQVVKMSKAT
jgi:hypothetical protein